MHRTITCTLAIAIAITPSLAHADGEPDTTFGTDGVVSVGLLDELGPVAIDSSGRAVVVGVHGGSIAFARYLPDGSPDTGFSGDGRADTAVSVEQFTFADIRVLANGSIIAAGERTTAASDPFSNGLWAAKVTSTGQPDTTYGGGDGVAALAQGYTAYRATGAFAADGSIVLSQIQLGGNGAVPISATGAFGSEFSLENDTSVIGAGCVLFQGERPFGTVSITSTEFVHAGTQGIGNCSVHDEVVMVTRQRTDGTVIWSAAILPPQRAPDDAQSHGIEIIGSDVVVATTDGTAATLHRFALADGDAVGSWGSSGRVTLAASFGDVGGIAELPDGELAVINAPQFPTTISATSLRIIRLLGSGGSDGSFTPVNVPVGAELTSTSVVGTSGGDVVATAATAATRTLRRFVGDDGSGGETPAAVTVTPARVLETRPGEKTVDGKFQGQGQLTGGTTTKIRIAGRGGVPTDANAAIVNLTMAAPTAPGFATLYPCTPTVPTASNINYGPGTFIANSVTAKLDANGDVCLFTLATTDALIDINGYIPAGSSVTTVTPARVLETRPGEKTVDGKFQGQGQLTGGTTTKIRIAGRGGVPTDANAAIVNLTMAAPTAPGFATLYPCTPTVPTASNINYGPGTFIANSVTAKLDANGDVCLFTLATTDALIDINGYIPAGSSVTTVTPARVLETRPGEKTVDGKFQGQGQLTGGTTTKIRIAGRGGVPTDANAAIVNLTMAAPTAPGFATLYPCTPTVPTASNINYGPGTFIANSVTAKLDANGDVCLFTLATTDALIDINGYITS